MENAKFTGPNKESLEFQNLNKKRLHILEFVKNGLENSKEILSAKAYGSWMYSEKSRDLDIFVIIPSNEGIVDPNTYHHLSSLRKNLCEQTKQDVDLVPHTQDEIKDHRSTLYYPRYNPSLVSGKNLKGKTEIEPVFNKNDKFDYGDLSAYILLDNRTICRRQLIRSFNESEGKIFVSKTLHGPGNALTYYSCKQKIPYLLSPSDLSGSLKAFDEIYKVNSSPAIEFFSYCKKKLDFEKALVLLKWYEHLVQLVLYCEKYANNYQKYCLEIKNLDLEK